ncbi:N-acetylmuramoyl-L-alanine amidase [Silvibacterium sp.]|uniref:N-acetylmuramoyl-L-alanine amidase n=1 Tax=Silvibacterium sp. TaxID=1964179 RepID=UPI0039E45E3E
MPVSTPFAGRHRLLPIAGGLMLSLLMSAPGPADAAGRAPSISAFDHAQRLREALEGRPERERTRREYDRVMDAYRAVYHGDPRSARADASVSAVADLLAEEGRIFQDDKALHDAIGQYDFLRKQYPGSRYRFSALLTIGEIYLRDLDDRDHAKATFQEFLKLYPQNPMANEAHAELATLRRGGPVKTNRGAATETAGVGAATQPAENVPEVRAGVNPPQKKSGKNTVLTAAKQSQQTGFQEQDLAPPPAGSVASTPPATASAASSSPAAPVSESHAAATDASLNAPPPPRRGKLPLITGIRHWSTPVYTRVAIDLQDEVQYEAVRVPHPDRIFFDLHGARLSPELIGKSVEVIDDGFLKQIRAAQFSNDVTRIVLDVSDVSEYSAFFLPNPSRLIIDIHGSKNHAPPVYTASTKPPANVPSANVPEVRALNIPAAQVPTTPPAQHAASRTSQAGGQGNGGSTIGIGPATTPVTAMGSPTSSTTKSRAAAQSDAATQGDPAALSDVATLGQQRDTVKATKHPTTAPVVQSVAGTQPAPQPDEVAAANAPAANPPVGSTDTTSGRKRKKHGDTSSNSTTTVASANVPATVTNAPTGAPPVDLGATGISAGAPPTADGQRSMVRALGLKINRIVVDAGHGGHDSGTLGPGGIQEKDVVLDVALRLGALLKQKLGADVIYTRDDDTFIPLETRTAIANKAQADLFISVHANSSQDQSARGVETYYLNFTTSADALETAARENSVSDESIHQLSDLVKKITLTDKINESREFASDVQQSLYSGLEDGNPGLKDRGVKKAPFVVLIGANMPSILAEISFLTNPNDAQELRDPRYRERIAESLYRGVARYVGSLNGVRIADASQRSK